MANKRIRIVSYIIGEAGHKEIMDIVEIEPEWTKAGKFSQLTQWTFDEMLRLLNEKDTNSVSIENVTD